MDEEIMKDDDWEPELNDQAEYITVKHEEMDVDSDDDHLYEGYYVIEEEVKEDIVSSFKTESKPESEYDQESNIETDDNDLFNEDVNFKLDNEVTEESSETNVDERSKESTQADLFQQPFVLKYLESHVQGNHQREHDNLLLENEYESFVDPKGVCRLCMKTNQNIFSRLFYTDKKLTPIATKLASLLGKEKVEEDLLPQQICLECSETVNTCYTSVKQFSEAYQILSEVVGEIKKKTHVFHKPGSTTYSMQLKIYDKCYEFCPCSKTTTAEKSNKQINSDEASSMKCYLCSQNFSSETLKDHMAEVHDCHIEYKCKSCSTSFALLHLLNKHDCSDADVTDIQLEHDDEDDVHSIEDSVTNLSQINEMNDRNKKRDKRILILELCDEATSNGTVDHQSCKYCPRIFKSTALDVDMKAHIASHVNDGDLITPDIDPMNINISQHLRNVPCYVCKFCQMPKATLTKLREHLSTNCGTFHAKYRFKIRDRRRHGKTRRKPVSCKTCADNILYTKKAYTLHVKENHPEHVYKCASCPSSFISRCALIYHNKFLHLKAKMKDSKENGDQIKDEKQNLLCEYCPKECKSLTGYRNHIKSHLKDTKTKSRRQTKGTRKILVNVEPLTCPVCKVRKNFKHGREGLDFHLMKHESPNGKISCCNREYDNFVKYTKHIKSHSRSWPCRSCGSSFESSVLLQDHVSSTHSKCPECAHVSVNLDEFIKHSEKCTKIRNHTCDMCNILFSTKQDLLAHKRQNHWDELREGDMKCDLPEPVVCCGKKFTKKVNLKTHTAKHQDTVCKTCGDVLKSRLALQNHNATHHRQGVECPYCHKSFCNTDSLKYHMLRHTQGRIFKCPCGLSFYTAADCSKHQRTRKSPCVGSMIQQAIVEVQPDDTEDVDYDTT